MADYDLQYQDTYIDVLLATANELKTAGYIYKGVATPSTNPGTPTERVAYLASEPGTYTNFGGIVITSGLYSLTYAGGTWTGTQMQAGSDIEVVQETGQSTTAVMSQKAVTDELDTLSASLQEAEKNITSHIYKDESVDIGGLPLALGAMQGDGSWAAVTSKSKVRSLFVPVTPGEKYILTQGAGGGTQYYTVIDTMFSTGSNQPASNIDYATGYTGRIDLTAGGSVTIDVPSDGHYLVVRADLAGGGSFAPTLVHKVAIDSRVDKINDALVAKHQVTEAYFDHASFFIADNVATYAATPNWSSKIIPVADLVAVDLIGTRSDYSTLTPPVVFLRGAEPTQANWIQGAEIYGSVETSSSIFKRLTTSSFIIPTEATHVLLQNANSISATSYIEVYDIDDIRNEIAKIKSRIVVVDAEGNGDYTTIADAIAGTSDGDTILVYPATYEESVHAFGKDRHIVGICKDTCILTNGTGNYDTPPLEMNIGSIENMTIIADNYAPTIPDPSENHNHAAYGIHIEYPNADPYTIHISNCKIVSKWSAGIGLGHRYNQTVIIDNCELISECVRIWSEWSNVWVEMGGLFFHNDAASNVGGTGKLRVKDTILRGKKAALVMESVENKVGTVDAEFIGGTLVSEDYGVGSGVIYRWPGTTTPEGYLCGSKITLAITAHGNNIAELNA